MGRRIKRMVPCRCRTGTLKNPVKYIWRWEPDRRSNLSPPAHLCRQIYGGKLFQQIVGIPMGTNCAPLLADIFLYSYEAEFIQSLLSTGKKRIASQFNFTYRYIDDVLSINNPFENYLGHMYPAELEIKDTTESNTSASYLDLLLSIESDGQLRTSLYDKRDDLNFHITNFPFLSSNILSSPTYGVLSHS